MKKVADNIGNLFHFNILLIAVNYKKKTNSLIVNIT